MESYIGLRKTRSASFFSAGNFWYNKKLALTLWFGLSVIAAFLAIKGNYLNNFIIFKHVFFHTRQGVNLYAHYPKEYYDVNLYGPLFSLVIAPFAWLPDKAGAFVWVLANTFFLWWAISRLPLPLKWRTFLLLLCAHEQMIASSWLQTNSLVCACILLGFSYIYRSKEVWALFFILAATFIKVYGIVGLAFFFFSKRPLQFIGWAIVWSIAFFLAPLLLTHFSFIVQSYKDWFAALNSKAAKNGILNDADILYQNISVMGMIRRIFVLPQMNDMWVLAPAIVLFVSQYLPFRYFKDVRYQLYLLCSVLITTVIFSNSAEAATYIIALPGMCIWYLLQPKNKTTTIFFIALFIFTTFAYSDLLTHWMRSHVYRPYSVKALPPFILWLVILVQIHRKQFLKAVLPFEKEPMPALR